MFAVGRGEGHGGYGALWPCWCCYGASSAWCGGWSVECHLAHGGRSCRVVTVMGWWQWCGGGRRSVFVFVFGYKLDLVCRSLNGLLRIESFLMQFWWHSNSERIWYKLNTESNLTLWRRKYFWQENLPHLSDMSDTPDLPHVKSFPDATPTLSPSTPTPPTDTDSPSRAQSACSYPSVT